MQGTAVFNLFYWTYFNVDYYVRGAGEALSTLASEPILGFIGATGTGIIFYLTREFSLNSVKQCSISPDDGMMKLQLYSLLGFSGEERLVSIGNAKIALESKSMDSSYVPVTIEGRERNIFFAKDGEYNDKNRLHQFLLADPQPSSSKESRVAWSNSRFSRKRQQAANNLK